tara:strand:+ start:6519 stop:7241 length:723 start_codon:yes stop_codon:yes gene_type:complete
MKLFRNNRRELIQKKGVLKYLAYAFGEILLVVFGILIAVYLNNWNEDKKDAKELQNILLIVQKDIKNDIREANEVVLFEKGKEKLYDRFFKGELTAKDYIESRRFRRLIFGFKEISFDKRGFKLLNNYKNNVEISKDSLISNIIELYTDRLEEVNADDKLRNLDFELNYNYWKNQAWWSDYIREVKSDTFIEYALHSQDYKNRVASWHFITFKAFIPELEEFIEDAEKINKLIESREIRK